jgi:hypothetical protein
MNANLAPVLGIRLALDESGGLQPVRQFHGSVMPQDQPVRQLADGRPFARRQSSQREQRLMLLRFKTVLSGLQLAEMKKLPELEPEFPQILVVA